MTEKTWGAFAFLFLIGLYSCVFLRVESWPFSDFGVYSYKNHPEMVLGYRLAIGNSEKEEWLYKDEGSDFNFSIQHIFTNMKDAYTTEELKKVLVSHRENICEHPWATKVILYRSQIICLDEKCERLHFKKHPVDTVPAEKC